MTQMPSQGGFLLSRAHRLSKRVFNRLLMERGIPINSGQGRILFVLLKEEGISIQQLAERASLSPSTLTSMLDRMEEDDLVKRRRSEGDRRAILLFLGEKAQDLRRDYMDLSKDMTELFYEGFSREERNDLEGYLIRIIQNLEAVERSW
ncbi:MAG TPA: MarR family transcriptional regulator [Methanomassiliicoccales archaeon]|nr:MarR family transcriptional regulator [Methanomassiliicoccales archaeon]